MPLQNLRGQENEKQQDKNQRLIYISHTAERHIKGPNAEGVPNATSSYKTVLSRDGHKTGKCKFVPVGEITQPMNLHIYIPRLMN